MFDGILLKPKAAAGRFGNGCVFYFVLVVIVGWVGTLRSRTSALKKKKKKKKKKQTNKQTKQNKKKKKKKKKGAWIITKHFFSG